MSKTPAYPSKVYLNGTILDASEARIPVFDRGFLFGDGIYEVIARINGRFFYEELHWDRLKECLRKIDIAFDADGLRSEVPALLEASGLQDRDCLLYIQVTRGVAPRQHSFPKDVSPTALMYAWEKTLPRIPEGAARTITREDFRWSRCDIKTTSLLGNVMANETAVQNACYETLFVRNRVVTEASHCNVFFVVGDSVYTHPADTNILNGISRLIVLELCGELGITVIEQGIPVGEIPQTDEAFLTGTSTQISAIEQIDDHTYGAAPGPVTRRLQEAFAKRKEAGA